MPNQISVIRPYKWEGLWVFDDPDKGLDKEPFVGGADAIIDAAVAHKKIRNADEGFVALFSAGPFPGADMHLRWVRHEMGGDVYQWERREGWLCPALLRYFDKAPESIYVQIKPREP